MIHNIFIFQQSQQIENYGKLYKQRWILLDGQKSSTTRNEKDDFSLKTYNLQFRASNVIKVP